ncbi:YphA family membrane protein [Paenibacillus nasutitermitis]|uniref:Uncharacterized protein n=1 Tax=Paenibacillus nasutitermitis TaxID=1652958 RepID=A0A916YZZ0_9BACL|nr:hypothetical protein [Paenibacillus nasutitermitis]GGD69346.1 hypothetical protein GCM10010911_29030 [Paenibacillus nasutitermitis]
MNEGFIACWFAFMLLILYMTGWKEQVADGVSRRVLAVFLLAVFVLHDLWLPLGNHLILQASLIAAVGAAILSVADCRNAGLVVSMLLSSLFAGMSWTWARLMYRADPVFIGLHPIWDGPLLAGIIGGLLLERFRHQFTLIVFAALMAFVLIPVRAPGGDMVLGSWGWWDAFAIALLAARVTTLLKEFMRGLFHKARRGRFS